MNKKIQLFLAASLLMFGCSKEEPAHIGDNPNSSLKKMEIVAGMPGDLTKTSFTDGSIKWQAEDALSVFVAGETNYKFNIKSGVGESEATFEGTAENGNAFLNNVAYYPYSEDVTVSHTNGVYTLNATFPAVQTYAANGSFGQNSLPMVAVTETTDITDKFQFNTLGGWLQLYVKGDKTITKVVMKAKGHKVAGAYSVTAACGQTPVMNMSDAAVSYVAVDCGAGIQLSNAEATLFTFAVAPFSFAAGEVSFDIYDNEGKFMPNAYTVPKGGTVIANAYYRISASAPIQYVGQEPAVKIGEVAYASLKDALAEVENGQTITLLGDVTTDETLVVAEGKVVTIDLSGKNLVGTLHKNVGSVLKNNGELTLKNGTVKSTAENGGSAVINAGVMVVQDAILNGAPNANGSWPSYTVNNTGNLTINNTTITSYHGAVASYNEGAIVVLNDTDIDMAGIPGFTNHAIYTYSNGRVVVNGGEIANKATDQNSTGGSVINGSVEVNAGNFIGRIENYYGTPILKGGTYNVKPKAEFIPAGYSIVENKIENVTYYSVVETMSTSAALQNAINNAKEGEVIYVGENITLDETIVIPEGKVITIDLNGKTITFPEDKVESTYAIRNLGNLTLMDSKGKGVISARGIYNGYGNGEANHSDARIIVKNGTYNAMGANGGAAIFNYGIADIQGGDFTSIGSYSLSNQAGSQMTIADGINANNGIYASSSDLTINGGNIQGNRSGCHVVYASDTRLTINGGDFYNNNSGNSTIMSAGTTETIINGGTFGIKDGRVAGNGNTWTSCLTDTQNSAKMTINGGTFNGGFRVQAGTTMNINDGSFNDATGSGYNIYGKVAITGGKYTDEPARNFANKYLSAGYIIAEDGTVQRTPYSYDESTNTYTVFTSNGLVSLSSMTIKAGANVVLAADIDLAGVEFKGLSAFNPEVVNTFDGNGYTISNWTYAGGASDMAFIKGWVGPIKNVKFYNCHLKTAGRSAIVAAGVYGNIDNINVENCSIEDSYWACGLIAGLYNGGSISNCTVKNSSVKSNGGTGAIVGVINESSGERKIANCSVENSTVNNTGIYGEGYSAALFAGILNADNATYIFENCVFNNNTKIGQYIGDLYYSAEGHYVWVDGNLVEHPTGYAVEDGNAILYNAKGMMWFANEVNVNNNSFSGKTVKLAADINLDGIDWEPIGQTGSTTFNGVFDGQNHTISNLSVDSESEKGAHYSSGLFGWVESHTSGHGHLKNVKISGATVNGHHNCGALVGYITNGNALVENCHVTGAIVSCTYANGDADGDKAGALIGNATQETPIKDCSATNSTITAGRDAGQVVGAGKEANITGCTASNVNVSANGTGTGKNVRNEVIGRLL